MKSVKSNKSASLNSSGDDSPIILKDEKYPGIIKNINTKPKPIIKHQIENNEDYQILIVDDVSFCRNQIENLINSYTKDKGIKFKIIHEDDGLGTINKVINDKANKLDLIKLIISDENMLYLNGSESFIILNKLFENNHFQKIPLIILTALSNIDELNFIKKKSQCDAIYKKPMDKSLIESIFHKYLLSKEHNE